MLLRRKHLLRTLLAVVCACSVSAGASMAAGSVQVTVDKLNVRSGPGLNHGVLTTLPVNTSLPVISETADWVQVRLPDGKTGWVANWLVKPVVAQTAASQIESQTDDLNVRSGPSTTFPVVQTIDPGTRYPVLKKSGQWVQIQLPGQQTGWVAGWLVKEYAANAAPSPASPAQPVPDSSPNPANSGQNPANQGQSLTLDFAPYVYPEPDETVPAIGQLQPGDTVQKLSEANGWAKIPFGGVEAWIRLRSAESPESPGQTVPAPESTTEPTTEPTSPAQPPDQSPQTTATVQTDTLNLRSEPTTASAVLATLSRGSTLTVLNKQGDWYQVKTQDGKTGWVAGWLVTVTGADTAAPADQTLTILNPDTNLRSGPGTSYEIVGRVQAGERYPIVNQSGDWYQIRLTDGSTAYVAGWLVTVNGTVPVVKGNELVGKVIVVDPGHGGNDNGATGSSFSTLEKTVNLQVAQMLRNKLEAAGAKVIMTRNDDRRLTLQQRVDIAVQNKADVFVSIHHNTHPNTLTNGTIVFYYNQGPSSKLASLVQNEIVKATQYKDLQARFGNYYVLRENPVTAILAEIGFLSNYNEEIRLRSTKQQDLAAEGIYKGLLQYFAANGN